MTTALSVDNVGSLLLCQLAACDMTREVASIVIAGATTLALILFSTRQCSNLLSTDCSHIKPK